MQRLPHQFELNLYQKSAEKISEHNWTISNLFKGAFDSLGIFLLLVSHRLIGKCCAMSAGKWDTWLMISHGLIKIDKWMRQYLFTICCVDLLILIKFWSIVNFLEACICRLLKPQYYLSLQQKIQKLIFIRRILKLVESSHNIILYQ